MQDEIKVVNHKGRKITMKKVPKHGKNGNLNWKITKNEKA